MGFLGNISVRISKEAKISGAIGQVTPIKIKSNYVSDTEIGHGQTNQWSIGGIDNNKSIAFYFDIVNTATGTGQKAHL